MKFYTENRLPYIWAFPVSCLSFFCFNDFATYLLKHGIDIYAIFNPILTITTVIVGLLFAVYIFLISNPTSFIYKISTTEIFTKFTSYLIQGIINNCITIPVTIFFIIYEV